MGDPLPPDPYQALGVAKDATAAAIKAQYRKLVLKCHPDKIQEESEKPNASDKFHKIQSAYEIISDEARRARYDAQVKLSELRKDVFGGGHARNGPDVRTGAFKVPTESARGGDFYARGPDRYGPRVSPQYEERRPSYAQEEDDYFGQSARQASRRRDEYERSWKRTSPREEKSRPSAREVKENERSSRKEKSRRAERDVRRERERKFPPPDIDSESDSVDEYERAHRKMREEDELRRAREQYYAYTERQKQEAANGYYPDERTQKMFSQGFDAREYIERSTRSQPSQQYQESQPRPRPESEKRPEADRKSPSKENVSREYIKRKDKPPVMIRRGSGRPATTGRDTGKSSKSEKERRPSIEIVEEPVQEPRREEMPKKPTLGQSKSSPADIGPVNVRPADVRPPNRRQRSYTLQEEQHKEEPISQIRRSDTTPPSPTAAAPPRGDSHRPKSGSRLRPETTRKMHPEAAYMTPDATPEPETETRRYNYGQQYADDMEFPTPDGYRTEIREPQPQPSRTRYTRSPSPMRERERDSRSPRRRRSSSKQKTSAPPPMPRTTSRTYIYPDEPAARPAMSRENSARLFGEVREDRSRERSSRSPRQDYTYPPPPPDGVRTEKRFREEDVKFATGYSRSSREKQTYSRNSSGQQIRV